MKSRRSLVLWAVLAAVATLAGAVIARMLTHPPLPLTAGTWLPRARSVADFTLTDLSGQSFGRQQLKGAPTLLFFGFTNCPDICPTTLATLAEVMRTAPLPGLRFAFVTVDPERDSADNLRQYLSAFDSKFIGLRGASQALEPLMKSVGAIAVRQNLADGSYTMDHSATLYLLDAEAQLVAVFTPPFNATALHNDLQLVAARGQF
ncbi:MAG: SCO family protein [Steroidobacteraceae bacterium]